MTQSVSRSAPAQRAREVEGALSLSLWVVSLSGSPAPTAIAPLSARVEVLPLLVVVLLLHILEPFDVRHGASLGERSLCDCERLARETQ